MDLFRYLCWQSVLATAVFRIQEAGIYIWFFHRFLFIGLCVYFIYFFFLPEKYIHPWAKLYWHILRYMVGVYFVYIKTHTCTIRNLLEKMEHFSESNLLSLNISINWRTKTKQKISIHIYSLEVTTKNISIYIPGIIQQLFMLWIFIFKLSKC